MSSEELIFTTLLFCYLTAAKASLDPNWIPEGPFKMPVEVSFDDIFTTAFVNVSYFSEKGWVNDKVELGRYGGGSVGPISGRVVHVTAEGDLKDHTGCSLPFLGTHGEKIEFDEPWIALVKRGRCSFETKVDHGFRSDASGILIYNDRDSSSLENMKLSTDAQRNVTAIFILKSKGEQMAELSRVYRNVMVYVTVAGQMVTDSILINRPVLLFITVSVILGILLSIAYVLYLYVKRLRHDFRQSQISERNLAECERVINSIPVKTMNQNDLEADDEQCCPICIDNYQVNDILRKLPCRHEYHTKCVDKWLIMNHRCPVCKMDVLNYYGYTLPTTYHDVERNIQEGGSNQLSVERMQYTSVPSRHRYFEERNTSSSSSSSSSSDDESTHSSDNP